MGRNRSHRLLGHWHRRELAPPDCDTMHWVLIDDPAHGAPHAECFRIVSPDGTTRGLHPIEAVRLLIEHAHDDAEHVRVETCVGQPFTH